MKMEGTIVRSNSKNNVRLEDKGYIGGQSRVALGKELDQTRSQTERKHCKENWRKKSLFEMELWDEMHAVIMAVVGMFFGAEGEREDVRASRDG